MATATPRGNRRRVEADGGNGHESIQGIAFMARESRPARPPEPRKEHRKEHRKGQFRSNSQGRPRDARQPQR